MLPRYRLILRTLLLAIGLPLAYVAVAAPTPVVKAPQVDTPTRVLETATCITATVCTTMCAGWQSPPIQRSQRR